MNNEKYLTPEDLEIAATNGISERLAKYRFYTYGWTKQRAITTKVRKTRGVWDEVKERCEANGISQKTYHSRIALGWSVEAACTTVPGTTKPISQLSKEDIARAAANGITLNTLKNRYYHLKYPIEEAVTMPVGAKRGRKKGSYKKKARAEARAEAAK